MSVQRTEIDTDDRSEAEDAAEETDAQERVTPKDPSAPPRHCQDAKQVNGETVTHMPEETRSSQHREIQG